MAEESNEDDQSTQPEDIEKLTEELSQVKEYNKRLTERVKKLEEKKKPSKGLIIAFTIYALLTIIIASYPYLSYHMPFYQNAMAGIDQLDNFKHEERDIDNKTWNLTIGYIREDDVGFKELRNVVIKRMHYEYFPKKSKVIEIGLLSKEQKVMEELKKTPLIYIRFLLRDDKPTTNIIEYHPVIFSDINRIEQAKLNELKGWVEDEHAHRVNNAMQFLIPLWSVSVVVTVALSLLRR